MTIGVVAPHMRNFDLVAHPPINTSRIFICEESAIPPRVTTPESEGHVNVTPKYIIVEGGGWRSLNKTKKRT